jgi:TolB protein
MSNRDGNYEIYTMAPDGQNQTRITNTPHLEIFPIWSPDGTKIAYSEKIMIGGKMQGGIRVINSDGSNDIEITSASTRDENPSWSPDGKYIVFQSVRDKNFEVYIIDIENKEQNRITSNPSWDGWPIIVPTKLNKKNAL